MWPVQFSSVTQSYLTLRLHESQHTRPPCPSPTPGGVHPNPCASSQWCHPAISSFVVPFSSCPQSFPVSGSSQMSQLFASGGQSTGVSASTSVLPVNTQDWSPLGWTGWISLKSKGLARVFSNTNLDSILKSRDITLPIKVQQSYGFSSSHVWMWQLDYKESWALKNWCFWTVMLEKTGKPGVLQSMGSQRAGHNWVTELNWPRRNTKHPKVCVSLLLHPNVYHSVIYNIQDMETP